MRYYGKEYKYRRNKYVFESQCILMTTESMLPLVTKSLLDLESIVKGEVIINSSENTFIDDNPEI